MPKNQNITRVVAQISSFLKGYRAYPKVLKGYKNIKPAMWFASHVKKFETLEKKVAKKEAELEKLNKERQKLANTIAPAVTKSRASARITLKGQKVVMKKFLG